MPNGTSSEIFATFMLPLGIAQWTPVPINSQRLPEVKATDAEWDVKTDGNVGIKVPRQVEGLLKDKKLKLSYVVFYCAVSSLPPGPTCAVSPSSAQFVLSLIIKRYVSFIE